MGSNEFEAKRRQKFLVQSVIWFVFLISLSYFLPGVMLFYAVCGLYDVSRNGNLDGRILYRYFFGNGVPTWALSPFNILMDIVTLPYINKKIYQLQDLPEDCQQEINELLEVVKAEKVVDELASRAEKIRRSMIFFKWYGKNIDNFYTVPAFHQDYKYIRTIGVSVFNKKESTDEHFGPLRTTLRVLYNINDIKSQDTYIKVRDVENHWCESKMFIFDDTLQHQSLNETDEPRYCLFVDIVRPSKCHFVMSFFVKFVAMIMQKMNHIFYSSWVPLK
ncbi:aspartyl/asparaginyl beta-hydroxylase domain-containing protein [Methyloprofundus sp.]|uniref:aspartyl/asparaginyl beta-hydroxylase domain-containing protein n=1 Tax=Methyloprofundus sp. TaxID=2020875 RepID=UPI003D0AFCC2